MENLGNVFWTPGLGLGYLRGTRLVVRILLEWFLDQVLLCKTCYSMCLSLQELMTLCETSSQIFYAIF